jgi:sugar O-acyltransferase (sialic acid O-acetyltransferase NeuD family)
MLMQDVVIIGAGGFGRELLDVFDVVNSIKPIFRVLGFIVDPRFGKAGDYVNEKPILGGFDWLGEHRCDVKAICGVAAPEQRFHLIERAQLLGVDFCSVIHPNAILTPRVRIGTGVVITAGCIFTNNIQIGDHVHINLDCTVGHDVVIEDFATISPGSHVSGKVIVRQGAFIGTGTNIIEKIEIGAWSTVGAGSAVVDDVYENSVAVGVPARIIKKKTAKWYLIKDESQG